MTALRRVCVCQPQYLACLKTSRSQTDKLSFDVGLQEDSTGKRVSLSHCSLSSSSFSSYFHSPDLELSHYLFLPAVFKSPSPDPS